MTLNDPFKPVPLTPFQAGLGRPDLEQIHQTVVAIDNGHPSIPEIRNNLALYANARQEADRAGRQKITQPEIDPRAADLPANDEGWLNDSAEFGQCWTVVIEWNTDADGKWIDFEDEPAITRHGPFDTEDEAGYWVEHAHEDDKDVRDMYVEVMNRVKPVKSEPEDVAEGPVSNAQFDRAVRDLPTNVED